VQKLVPKVLHKAGLVDVLGDGAELALVLYSLHIEQVFDHTEVTFGLGRADRHWVHLTTEVRLETAKVLQQELATATEAGLFAEQFSEQLGVARFDEFLPSIGGEHLVRSADDKVDAFVLQISGLVKVGQKKKFHGGVDV